MNIIEAQDTVVRSKYNEKNYSDCVYVWTGFYEDTTRQRIFFDMLSASIDNNEECFIRICFEI